MRTASTWPELSASFASPPLDNNEVTGILETWFIRSVSIA